MSSSVFDKSDARLHANARHSEFMKGTWRIVTLLHAQHGKRNADGTKYTLRDAFKNYCEQRRCLTHANDETDVLWSDQ